MWLIGYGIGRRLDQGLRCRRTCVIGHGKLLMARHIVGPDAGSWLARRGVHSPAHFCSMLRGSSPVGIAQRGGPRRERLASRPRALSHRIAVPIRPCAEGGCARAVISLGDFVLHALLEFFSWASFHCVHPADTFIAESKNGGFLPRLDKSHLASNAARNRRRHEPPQRRVWLSSD